MTLLTIPLDYLGKEICKGWGLAVSLFPPPCYLRTNITLATIFFSVLSTCSVLHRWVDDALYSSSQMVSSSTAQLLLV